MSDAAKVAAITDEQLHILRHSLGVPDPGQTNMYRNHFVTGEGSTDWPICISLTARGFMRRRAGSELSGGDDVFQVTDEGKALVRRHLESASNGTGSGGCDP